ncbi:catalase [Rothia uropygioeca]|uniref:catalase n=1 Tax=Kocuria sp. 257 TaxID=2021970 RepID=UPI001011AC18|nr:catalase [Kocuria sp. 257]
MSHNQQDHSEAHEPAKGQEPQPIPTPPPGRPNVESPSAKEPTNPQPPWSVSEDQHKVVPRTPTGEVANEDPDSIAQHGSFLTTSAGSRLRDTDHSLKAGERGPSLLQDHHFREKITHFDHERVPERVVHARGAGAHGFFEAYGNADSVTRAGFLAQGKKTPVFVRFSTVLGSRGSADSVRDTRGFATKFYTEEGTFDLVGNNIPVFFIQDAIKFPDVIHAGKPHPDREIPQAQSAHDTFWDFVSLHTEAQHHTMWNMSDRGIPRSYRMMEGFGIHTFRLQNASGETCLVKFHWKPKLGVHSMTWEEAQITGGMDPDFHRRDLADAIESGAYPEWELGIQVFEDTVEQMYEGIDLLDPTKIVPEEKVPVQLIGRMVLDSNPRNYFEETEQVAFHPGHLPPGIDVTDDPLLQGRLFSYIDTQLTRLGGPNFNQLPINRPHAPVNDMFRDGYGQQADHTGVAPYKPNSLDGNNPFAATEADGAFTDLPVTVAESVKTRAAPASFDDHFSQVRLFWNSLTDIEKDHVVGAYSFELGKCYETAVQKRQVENLARIDKSLCQQVADSLGLPTPDAQGLAQTGDDRSPALSQIRGAWPVDGRVIGIVVDPQDPPEGLADLHESIVESSMVPNIVSTRGGEVSGVPVTKTLTTVRSVEFDAIILAGAPSKKAADSKRQDAKTGVRAGSGLDPRVDLLLDESWRHGKAIGAWGPGTDALHGAGYSLDDPGIVTGSSPDEVLRGMTDLLSKHRVWERFETTSDSV